VEPTRPSEADGSSDGEPKEEIDRLLARLLVDEVRVKVDPLTGEILDSDDDVATGEEASPPVP
jgi:hypothetical protein